MVPSRIWAWVRAGWRSLKIAKLLLLPPSHHCWIIIVFIFFTITFFNKCHDHSSHVATYLKVQSLFIFFVKHVKETSRKWLEPVFEHQNQTIIDSITEKKSRAASWIVSHCEAASKRDILVKHLKKFINVTIYGSCGINSWVIIIFLSQREF